MKKILISLLLSLFFLQSVYPSEPSETTDQNKIVSKSYVYLAPAIALPLIPSMQAGIRVQHNHFGFGVQFTGSYYFLALPCEVSASFLYYKNPAFDKPQNYFGISLGAFIPVGYNNIILPAGSLLFGREFFKKNGKRRFWETYVGFPSGIGFRYGFCF